MKIRIKFRKYGSMRFIGHLDVMRYFQKAIRRAGIDIAYSEGFSPHPVMSFAAPLGVGLTSDGEYMDIEVRSTRSTEESIAALNGAMAEGFEVTEYVALRDGAAKAMAAVAAADYAVWFKKERDFSPEEIAEKIDAYYVRQEKIEVVKQTKKSERTVDLKPLIYRFEPWRDEENTGFFLRLCTGSAENIKPELALTDFYRFFGRTYDPMNMQIHRIEVYEDSGNGLTPLYRAGDDIES